VLELLLAKVTVALPAGLAGVEPVDLAARHEWRSLAVDVDAFAASGLATETMGRGVAEDPLFFGAALAGGAALADLAGGGDAVARG
jgi:hypothetical protein